MRVAVVGSRKLCVDISPYILPKTTEIVTCGMPGVCMLASRYADDHGLPKLIIKANYMRAMGLDRQCRGNIVLEVADMVVAIWDGKSLGAACAIRYARGMGKPVHVHVIEDK